MVNRRLREGRETGRPVNRPVQAEKNGLDGLRAGPGLATTGDGLGGAERADQEAIFQRLAFVARIALHPVRDHNIDWQSQPGYCSASADVSSAPSLRPS